MVENMKKNIAFNFIIFLLTALTVDAQIVLKANKTNPNGYAVVQASGLDYESPDCVHTGFGNHITQVFDSTLERDVFEFHSHINDDNDRCVVFDRVRMEIKGGPGTNDIGQHELGTTSYYRWKFKIGTNYIGSSSFCHLFQNKAKDGDDDDPVITVTSRASIVELRHLGGTSGADLGTLVKADISLFRNRWVEVYIKMKHAENGSIEAFFKDVVTGKEIMKYKNDNIDLWRKDATYSRPKWGVYRLKNSGLKDETVSFADFCISETEEAQCPTEIFVPNDVTAPSIPKNLKASNITRSSVKLTWSSSTDNFRLTGYKIYADGVEVWKGADTSATLSNLVGGKTYSFAVAAFDFKDNESAKSSPIIIMTDDPNALPSISSQLFPANNNVGLSTNLRLTWLVGNNTDSINIYLDTIQNPKLFKTIPVASSLVVNLLPNKTYFWQIGGKNLNGERKSEITSFKTTAIVESNGPWKVYRGNQSLEKETSFFTALELSPTPEILMSVNDPNGSSNKYFGHHESDVEKLRWRYAMNSKDTAITVVGRIRGINPDITCITYYEVRAFGFREKLRLNKNTIKLERSSPIIEVPSPSDISNEFHVMRMTMKGNKSFVYIDENPVPVAEGVSTTNDAGFNFEYGKSGTNECGGYIDWLAILDNNIHAPGQGPALPSDLFLSSDANLKEIKVNGDTIPKFDKNVYVYNVDVKSRPIIQYTVSSPLAKVSIDSRQNENIPYDILRVTAQDGFTEKQYRINYNFITKNNDIEYDQLISIYPNPATNMITIDLLQNEQGTLNIYNIDGGIIKTEKLKSTNSIDVSELKSGNYIFNLKLSNNINLYKNIIKI
jgi:hypothetical protein